MRLAVVGAGIVGVTTAYELAADGHEVAVFERSPAVATGTSFANAGVIAPGYVTPWAAPGMPAKVLGHLLSRHAPVRLAWPGWIAELPWMWRWWRACRPQVYAANRSVMQRLAQLSVDRMRQLTRTLALDYEQADGYLVLLRSARDAALARPGLALLDELGVGYRMLDAGQARAVEPALNAETPLAAAIHLPQDGVGNCRHFAHLLKAHAQALGTTFHFEQTVRRIVAGPRPSLELAAATDPSANDSRAAFDGVVVCAGPQSAALMAPLGLRLPLAPVYGYSVTAPLRRHDGHGDAGPRSALMDEKYKVAISRLGQRVRVAGSAELGGRPDRHDPRALQTLYKVLDDWFPGAAAMAQAQVWKGARPMMPDGPPVIGPSGADGVWLNLGHGSSGWALACGSARVLADLVAGRSPELDVARLQRFVAR